MLMALAWFFMIGSFLFIAIAVFSSLYGYWNKLTVDGKAYLIGTLIRKLIIPVTIFIVSLCYIFVD